MNNGDGRHHLNVPLVWQEGLTGRGVSVLVLDDNVDSHNPEISRNYVRASFRRIAALSSIPFLRVVLMEQYISN